MIQFWIRTGCGREKRWGYSTKFQTRSLHTSSLDRNDNPLKLIQKSTHFTNYHPAVLRAIPLPSATRFTKRSGGPGEEKTTQPMRGTRGSHFDYFLFTTSLLYRYFLQDKRVLGTKEVRKQPKGFFASIKRY